MIPDLTRRGFCVSLAALPLAGAPAEPAPARLAPDGFRSPPVADRPHAIWMWMGANVTRAGITRDLVEYRAKGLGGVCIMPLADVVDPNPGAIQGNPTPDVVAFTPPWFALLRHACEEAKRLGLTVAVSNCPGYASTGGPWIPVEKSMKQLVWFTREVDGAQRFRGRVERTPPQAFFGTASSPGPITRLIPIKTDTMLFCPVISDACNFTSPVKPEFACAEPKMVGRRRHAGCRDMRMAALEICVEDLAGVRAARAGGADRVELCAALALGGVMPAHALVADAVREGLPVHVLVRLATGDFLVDQGARDRIAREIAAVGALGAAGVVVGALTEDHRLDQAALAQWRRAADGLTMTLHRAIDLALAPVAAVADAVALDIDRILTSGGAASAPAGSTMIAAMVAAAAGRIEIMAGAGVTPGTAATLLRATRATALHASASSFARWPDPRVPALGFGPARRRYTDIATVRALKKIAAASL